MAPPVRIPLPRSAPAPGATPIVARAGWLAPPPGDGACRLTPHRRLADLPTWGWLVETGLAFGDDAAEPLCVPSRRAALVPER